MAVGVSNHLSNEDRVFGAHRSHAHLLALGGDLRKLFSEILGRENGHSRGMGGSMHLWDESVGFLVQFYCCRDSSAGFGAAFPAN